MCRISVIIDAKDLRVLRPFLSQNQESKTMTETSTFVLEAPRDQEFVLDDNITVLVLKNFQRIVKCTLALNRYAGIVNNRVI